MNLEENKNLQNELIYFKEDILKDLRFEMSKLTSKIEIQKESFSQKVSSFESKVSSLSEKVVNLSNNISEEFRYGEIISSKNRATPLHELYGLSLSDINEKRIRPKESNKSLKSNISKLTNADCDLAIPEEIANIDISDVFDKKIITKADLEKLRDKYINKIGDLL